MKPTYLFIIPAAILATVSCSTITPTTDTTTKVKQGVPGGEIHYTSKINATVTGIDAAKRNVTFVTTDGKKFDLTAGPEVENFNQIRLGDQLRVTYSEELVIRMAKPGEKIKDSGEAVFDIAPKGAKPGVMTSETLQAIATVTAIDMKKHKATFQFADGYTRTVAIRQDVDLTKRKVGEKVVIQTTEVYAIRMEKP